MFAKVFDFSIVKRAQQKGLVNIKFLNLRSWATDKHKTVDDKPYGGGPGMLLKVDVVDRALKQIKDSSTYNPKTSRIYLLDARGKTFNQNMAVQLSELKELTLVSGHYEGVDYRVQKYLVDGVISVGNFVLSGGEIPAMVIVDTVTRLVPGVIDPASLEEESFTFNKTSKGVKDLEKEYPQYTRPVTYNGWSVPKILLSGDHKKITDWKTKRRAK